MGSVLRTALLMPAALSFLRLSFYSGHSSFGMYCMMFLAVSWFSCALLGVELWPSHSPLLGLSFCIHKTWVEEGIGWAKWFVDKNWRPWVFSALGLGLPSVHWPWGEPGRLLSSWLPSAPPALCAGAALLEVGTAAAAHGAVLPGGLCPLCGLHPCI